MKEKEARQFELIDSFGCCRDSPGYEAWNSAKIIALGTNTTLVAPMGVCAYRSWFISSLNISNSSQYHFLSNTFRHVVRVLFYNLPQAIA
jgi:hypothetical protein